MLKTLLLVALTSCSTTRAAGRQAPPGAPTISIPDIDSTSVALVKLALAVQEAPKELVLKIDSHGGEVMSGLELIVALEDFKATNGTRVTCVVDFRAFSMAAVILQSSVCDVRLMTSRSLLLFHKASLQIRGNADDLDEAAQVLRAIDYALLEMCARRLKMPMDEMYKRTYRRNWVLSAEQALAVGAIDGIVYL